ncbi:MAG: UbiA family prenyltransferase [Thermoplasmataceae archaeon]
MNSWIRILRPINGVMGLVATWISGFIGVGYRLPYYFIALLIASISVFLVTSAGNVLNDILDQDTDKINHPNRPIPSGEISIKSAKMYSTALFIIPFVIIIPGTVTGIYSVFVPIIVLLAELLLISYETRTKNIGLWGNATVSVLVGLIFIYGGVSVGAIAPMVILFVLAALSNFSREVIKDIEDMGGDSDRITFPKKHGVRMASTVATSSIVIAVVISVFPFLLGIFPYPYLVVVLVADIIFLFSVHKIPENPKRSQTYSKYAMITALVAYVVGAIALEFISSVSLISISW